MRGPPQFVIRFYGNLQYALECIALKQITLLHADKLNDPFDPNFYFETDFNDDYQVLLNYVRQYHENCLNRFMQIMPEKNWGSFINGIEENYFKNLRNSTFIFSTCEVSKDKHPKDNLYMWNHYSNGHRGVAIEFDTSLLAEAVLENQERIGGEKLEPWLNPLSEINYQDEVPRITCEHIFQFIMDCANNVNKEALEQTQLAKTIRETISLKGMVWKEEKEWRLMKQNDETKLKFQRVDLLDNTITAVYLGLRYKLIEDLENDAFFFETRRNFPRADIFQALRRKGEFALDFERIAGPDSANN